MNYILSHWMRFNKGQQQLGRITEEGDEFEIKWVKFVKG
jgi:hypothetical protein